METEATTSETEAATEAAQTTTEAAETTDVEKQAFLERLNKESAKRKDSERENKELRERLEALESKDQSELERERKAREKAEQERQQFASRVESLEKGGWVRDAAAAANFHNPSAAASFLDLSEIDSQRDAERAVKDLAKREQYLVKAEDDTPPKIGQVLKDGKPADGQRPKGGIDPMADAQVIADGLRQFASKDR